MYRKNRRNLERELSICEREIARVNVEIIALDNRIKEAKNEL